jgi:hypothetical protein
MLIGAYLLWLVSNWVWFAPALVSHRLESSIRQGMRSADVEAALRLAPAFDVPAEAYCAPKNNEIVTRIALYNPGGVSLILMAIPTTATFCFDAADKLVAFKVSRWIDGP